MVDVQPHYFGGLIDRVDLVIDHHPEQPGYSAVFKDIRADYGSTSTILTEHLRAVDVNISERTATAMLYAIKSDTLFFARHTNRVDLEAFTFLYPLADAALIRKMEGAEITLERLDYVTKAQPGRRSCATRCSAPSSATRRARTSSPTSPTSSCSSKTSSGRSSPASSTAMLIDLRAQPRLLKNAGEFVKRWFADIGSAGGHRAMAKAVVPIERFRGKFGDLDGTEVTARIAEMAEQFLHESAEKKEGSGRQVEPRSAAHTRSSITGASPRGAAGAAPIRASSAFRSRSASGCSSPARRPRQPRPDARSAARGPARTASSAAKRRRRRLPRAGTCRAPTASSIA